MKTKPTKPPIAKLRTAFRSLLRGIDDPATFICGHLHHGDRDLHRHGQPCPVEARVRQNIAIIKEALK